MSEEHQNNKKEKKETVRKSSNIKATTAGMFKYGLVRNDKSVQPVLPGT